jgi:hypothetical protein
VHERPAVVRLGLRENAAQFALVVASRVFAGFTTGAALLGI